MLNKRLIFALLICTIIPSSWANELVTSGYFKGYLLGQDEIDIQGSLDDLGDDIPDHINGGIQSQNAMRLMINYFSGDINVEMHYEIQPIFSNYDFLTANSGVIGNTLSSATNVYRYKDLETSIFKSDTSFVTLQNLDRFNLQYTAEWGDTTIGRQVVAFGSARFINPTDIFVPFAIQTLNQEYRVGIDAIRSQISLGDFSTLDLGLVVGEDGKKNYNAVFARYQQSVAANDIELIGISLADAYLLGGGIERAIGDFGAWLETAYLHAHGRERDDQAMIDDTTIVTNIDTPLMMQSSTLAEFMQSYWRTSAGIDYAITEEFYVAVEYHFNGAGSDNPDDYLSLSTTAPYQRGGVYLFGKHYLIPSFNYQINALSTLSSSAFINLNDQSTFIAIHMEHSWSDNLYSDLGVYLASGHGLLASNSELQVGSEFGFYPETVYASLRYYF
ncbi:hypothetical protein FE810_06700 [Thalassotalea litorea]|uniref:DUF5723 domain-containing protein n=1 Tax=Thalassotalea litorea TaxID=2020715 RepID=A0A5R9ILG9_9GAMM|nr:hypothetical protein [Thalassotalea litorea]TLU66374.1 hypothetical protein FE810_06700 [Thalassotalea litorea]